MERCIKEEKNGYTKHGGTKPNPCKETITTLPKKKAIKSKV